MRVVQAFIILHVCLVLASPAATLFAHGSGASFEVEQNGVLIDIGYTPEEFVAAERVRFDLDVYNVAEPNNPSVEFTNVWLRLTQNGRVFFSGNLYSPIRTPTVVTIQLPPAGDYELSARFYDDDTIVADAVFPLTVVAADSVVDDESNPPSTAAWLFTLDGMIISTVVAAGVVFFAGLLTGRVIRKSRAAH